MSQPLTLVSHHLCPYVQRAAISLAEKQVPYRARWIDLSQKPGWFTAASPLGKVPLLIAGDHLIFESAVILEYLEETQPHPLHPENPERRAEHRSWIEFGSSILNDIGGFYSARDSAGFNQKRQSIRDKLLRVEHHFGGGEWFGGGSFSLVDAVYGPIFRYFDTFEDIDDFGFFTETPQINAWRRKLADRASVKLAVSKEYPQRLMEFIQARGSHLSALAAA